MAYSIILTSIWQSFWHILWHSRFDLASILTKLLAYVLTCFLAFYLASIPAFYLASFKAFILAFFRHMHLAYLLTLFLACFTWRVGRKTKWENGGTPIAGWFLRKIPLKIDLFWGTPMTSETSISKWYTNHPAPVPRSTSSLLLRLGTIPRWFCEADHS